MTSTSPVGRQDRPTKGLYPDPTSRFVYRWWDGRGWTSTVVGESGTIVSDRQRRGASGPSGWRPIERWLAVVGTVLAVAGFVAWVSLLDATGTRTSSGDCGGGSAAWNLAALAMLAMISGLLTALIGVATRGSRQHRHGATVALTVVTVVVGLAAFGITGLTAMASAWCSG